MTDPSFFPSSDTPGHSPDFAATPPQSQENCEATTNFEPPQPPPCGGSKNPENASVSAARGGVAAKSAKMTGGQGEEGSEDLFSRFFDQDVGSEEPPIGNGEDLQPTRRQRNSLAQDVRDFAAQHPKLSVEQVAKRFGIPKERVSHILVESR